MKQIKRLQLKIIENIIKLIIGNTINKNRNIKINLLKIYVYMLYVYV